MFTIRKILTTFMLVIIIISGVSMTKGYCGDRYIVAIKDQFFINYIDTSSIKAFIDLNNELAILDVWAKYKVTNEGIKPEIQFRKSLKASIQGYQNLDYKAVHWRFYLGNDGIAYRELLEETDYSQTGDILDSYTPQRIKKRIQNEVENAIFHKSYQYVLDNKLFEELPADFK